LNNTDTSNEETFNSERTGLGYSNKKNKIESVAQPINQIENGKLTNGISFQKATLKSDPQSSTGNNNFMDQIKEATEKARQIAEKLKTTAKPMYPTSFKPMTSVASNPMASMTDEQKKQYIEQKEVFRILNI
jgi:hypothetical protein